MVNISVASTDEAPAAIGPYSQAVLAGGLVFCSGQIALDPRTSEVVGQDVESQTVQALRNLAAVLGSVGSDLRHVIKTTVYLTDLDQYQRMNHVYARIFGDHAPARVAVEVSALPRDVLVEIDCVAALPSYADGDLGTAMK